MTVTSPLKWHGGKHYLAARLVTLMPPHVHYVEPYAGGLSVLLAKPPDGVSEVVNDISRDLTTFWRVLQDVDAFDRFRRVVEAVPFSQVEWNAAAATVHDTDVAAAVAFFVRCRMSLAGRMDAFAPLSRVRTRRGMNEQVSAWLTAVDGLLAVHSRLRRVAVLDAMPALDVIRGQDGTGTLFYLDPPYHPEVRAASRVYQHEMSADDHGELLDVLAGVRARFLLSGYGHPLYAGFAARAGWRRHDFELPNNAAGGRSKRRMTECVWTNF